MAGISASSRGQDGTSFDGSTEPSGARSFAFEWDPGTDQLWLSPACAEILGLEQHDRAHTGEAYRARVDPADRERFMRRRRRLKPGSPSYQVTYRLRRPAGDVVLLEESGHGAFDAAGHLLRVIGLVVEARPESAGADPGGGGDDAARARPQSGQADEDSGAWLRFALEAAEAGVWSWELAGGSLTWSPESYALYGLDPALGPPSHAQWLACLHPDDRQAVNEALWDAIEGRAPEFRAEFRVRRPDGSERWLLARGRLERGPDKVVRRLSGIHLDISERRELEARLRRRERELQTLAQNAPDIIARFDRDLRHVYVNSAVARATGRPPEEFIGRTNEELGMPPELCRLWADTYHEVFRRGRPRSLDFDFHAPGGQRHYSVRAVPEFGANGAVETVLVIARDETYRRRTEQALEDNRARLQRVITGSQDGYWECRFGTGQIWVSARWNQIVGRLAPEGPVAVEDVEPLVHPDDLPKLLKAIAPILEGRGGSDHCELEYRFCSPAGGEVWVHSRARVTKRDAQGAALMISGLITDITLRKRIEQALRDSETLFRSMFDLASVGMAQAEPLGMRFLRVNACYCRLTGYSAEELLQMDCWQLIHPEDRASSRVEYERMVRGELAEYLAEKRIVCKDTSERWLLVNATIIRDAGGAPLRTVAVVVDTTARRQAEQALKDADRRKNEFLAMLGHELRNPLTPIRNAAEIMRLLDLQEPRLRWVQEVIARQVTHLTRLVDDLLDLSRIVRGKIELKREPLPVGRAVDQAVDEVRAEIERHGQRLVVALPEEPVWVHADPVRLSQVLVNLLHNAAKYTPDSGEIQLLVETDGAEVAVRVRDSGCGIDPGLLPRVFDLFAQGEQALDRRQGGLGIGLTVVRQLVGLHGGQVTATSAGRDRGAEFTVRLPQCAAPQSTAPPAEATWSARRVLVVEDDAAVADTTATWLQLRGYQVQLARDGRSAMELAERFRPDVVLLDIGLPDMDGYQVAARLRAQAREQAVLLVAVTGYGHPEALAASRAAGFDHHLIKPVDPQRLVALLG